MPRKKRPGYRRRFNFVLSDDERDRVVAQWLNQQPNASEAIKALIYAEATGQVHSVATRQAQPAAQAETPAGSPDWVDEEPPPAELDFDDPKVRALRGAIDT